MRHIFLLFTFYLAACSGGLFAQVTQPSDSTDLSALLDDGGLAEARNLLRLNFFTVLQGDLSLSYERKLTDGLGIEAGLGLLLPIYRSERPDLTNGASVIDSPASGVSLFVMPRYYYLQTAPERGYLGLLLRQRRYRQADDRLTIHNDAGVVLGWQAIFERRFTFDAHAGMGARFQREGVMTGIGERVGLVILANVGLGIVL